METTTTNVKSAEIQTLEERINVLTELNTRVEKLRHAPSVLRLQPGSSLATNVLVASPATLLRESFGQLKELSDTVKSDPLQNALQAATESEAKDPTELVFHARRKNVKRTRPPSPESPQPFRAFQPKSLSLSFPPQADPPLRKEALVEYIKDLNRRQTGSRLHVWSSSCRPRDGELPSPLIIRFTIRDVLVVYLTLGYIDPASTIVIEDATAFGPREKKPPHSQSDYTVYQRLSQQMAKMIQSQPQVSFQQIVVLLTSYEDLFVRRCTACQRVLSAEGHVPPVARVWLLPSQESDVGTWDARHPDCLQS